MMTDQTPAPGVFDPAEFLAPGQVDRLTEWLAGRPRWDPTNPAHWRRHAPTREQRDAQFPHRRGDPDDGPPGWEDPANDPAN